MMSGYPFGHEVADFLEIDQLSKPYRLGVFLIYTAFDLAINAAAGAAAAAAAGHAIGTPATADVLRLAALAGLTKSGIVSGLAILGWFYIDCLLFLLMAIVMNPFVLAQLLTISISAVVLGEGKTPGLLLTPISFIRKELCIAALAAAIPLHFQLSHHLAWPPSNLLGLVFKCIVPCCCCISFPPIWPVAALPLNCAGAVIFAAVARKYDFPLCPLSVAATAAAVYGTVTMFPTMCISYGMNIVIRRRLAAGDTDMERQVERRLRMLRGFMDPDENSPLIQSLTRTNTFGSLI
ncbi:hypothetical protein V8E54_011196 [Elaphomyces granulatus]